MCAAVQYGHFAQLERRQQLLLLHAGDPLMRGNTHG